MSKSAVLRRALCGLAIVLLAGSTGYPGIIDGSGNPDPTWNSNSMLLWLKADAGVTYDGSNKVSAWADQSTYAYQIVQSTAAQQPTYSAAGLNGGKTLLFDGNDYMSFVGDTYINNNSDFHGPTGYQTAFIMYKDTSTQDWVTPLGSSFNGKGSYHGYSDDKKLFSAAYTDTATLAGANYRNGGLIDYATTGRPDNWALDVHVATAPLAQRINSIGSDLNGANRYDRSINGGIAEVILYNYALSSSELYQVSTYLQNKYTPTYGSAVATTAKGYWRLGESSGSAVNSASATYGSLNGTYNGFPPGVRAVAGVTSFDADGAAKFDGSQANVSGSGLNSIPGGNPFARGVGNSWTIEAWFVRDAATNDWQAIFSNNTASPYKAPLLGFFDNSHNRNTLGLNPSGDSPNVVVGTTLSNYLGKRVYAALTDTMSDLGGGNLLHSFTLYVNVDGTWLSTATGSWNEATSGYGQMGAYDGFLIGQHYSGSSAYRFSGTIDEVAIYNTALDQATIFQHFAIGSVPEPGSIAMLASGGLVLAVFGVRRLRRRAAR